MYLCLRRFETVERVCLCGDITVPEVSSTRLQVKNISSPELILTPVFTER